MFGLDPEKIMRGIMASTGVSPEDFMNFLRMVQTEIAELRADRQAFKPASAAAYKEVLTRLDRIETKLDRLLPDISEPRHVELITNERNPEHINGHAPAGPSGGN